MPTYTFQCKNRKCKNFNLIKEEILKIKELDDYKCSECLKKPLRIFNATPSFQLKGNGFYKKGTF